MPNFAQVVKQVFDGWTVLQLAVEHGFGGAESAEKGEWMVTAVEQWFSENADLEPYEVEDFLAQLLDAEFNTLADDGSLIEVSKILCTSHQLLQRGATQELEKYLLSLPKKAASGQSVTPAVTCEGQEEEQMDTEECCECSAPANMGNTNNEHGKNSSDKAYSEAESVQEEEEDGWTVVRKGKRR